MTARPTMSRTLAQPGTRAPIGHEPARGELDSIRHAITAYWAEHSASGFDPAAPVVRLHEPTFGPDEIMAAVASLLSTRVTMGAEVTRFERAFATHAGTRHAAMSNSGSSANLLAVAALVAGPHTPDAVATRTTGAARGGARPAGAGLSRTAGVGTLRPGDEVIVSALSWSTTVWPLLQHDLVPVVVDIDPFTWNLDPDAAAAAIGPRTRAIMPVHVYGNPCDMDALVRLCDERDLVLIEDCCEALGATWDGQAVGTFGAIGTYSFYYSHHITTLEGGMCVSDDDQLAERQRILRAHGWIRDVADPSPWRTAHPDVDEQFLFVDLGYNLRPTEVAGTIGSVQLPRLRSYVRTRRDHAAFYSAHLARFGGLFASQRELAAARSSWFGYGLRLADDAPCSIDDLRRHLERDGIETRPIICGNIARQPALAQRPHRVPAPLPHADAMMDRACSFGCHQALSDDARTHVVDSITAFVEATT